MSRRQQVWTATEGRDAGRQFLITELDADRGERWAIRALLALANAGAKLPEGVLDAGMAGVAASLPGLVIAGIRSLQGLDYVDAAPLLDEMMDCVKVVPPGQPTSAAVPLLHGPLCQVEEIRTRLQLRREVLQVHVNFSLADLFRNGESLAPLPPEPSA